MLLKTAIKVVVISVAIDVEVVNRQGFKDFGFMNYFYVDIFHVFRLCWVSLVVASGGCSLATVHRLLIAMASPVAEHRV